MTDLATLLPSLRRCAREANNTYVGRNWPSMETLRRSGVGVELTESGDGDRRIRRFLSTFSPEFVLDLLDVIERGGRVGDEGPRAAMWAPEWVALKRETAE